MLIVKYLNCTAVLANGFGLRSRMAQLFRRVLGHPFLGVWENDSAGSDRRARIHLPFAGSNHARKSEQGSQRLHGRATDTLPQPQYSRLSRFSSNVFN